MADADHWLMTQLGSTAQQLCEAIPVAIAGAHANAAAAQVAAETAQQDTYGQTLKVKQHEELVAVVGALDGMTVRKPNGGRFDLVVITETSSVLLPIRYSSERKNAREKFKLRTPISELRLSLLAEAFDRQMTLDQADVDPQILEAEEEEQKLLTEQLQSFGNVVVVGYGCNSANGVWGLGLGEIRILDPETGQVEWPHWVPLEMQGAGSAQRPRLYVVDEVDKPEPVTRFDDDEDDDNFDMRARHDGEVEPPTSESPREPKNTGEEGGTE